MSSKDLIFTQLCIEFHSRFFEDVVGKKEGILKKLDKLGYYIAFENKKTEEYTFVKR